LSDSLTRELEKKFSDRHVVFIGQRRMMRKPTRVSRVKQQRPRSRTLKEVHEKILEDLVYPTVSLRVCCSSTAARNRRWTRGRQDVGGEGGRVDGREMEFIGRTGGREDDNRARRSDRKHLLIAASTWVCRRSPASAPVKTSMDPRSSRCTSLSQSSPLVHQLTMCYDYSFLDAKDATSLEYKLDSFSSVYRRLTGKEVGLSLVSPRTLADASARSTLSSPLSANKCWRCIGTEGESMSEGLQLPSFEIITTQVRGY
jgi:hypothetical protein